MESPRKPLRQEWLTWADVEKLVDVLLSQLRAATDPRAKGGRLYGPLWTFRGAPVVRPVFSRPFIAGAIATLWDVSRELTGVSLDLHAAAT